MYFEAEDGYIITDLAVFFIGITMLVYGALSFGGNLSVRYTIAATISSFLLVLAEWIITSEQITGRRMVAHGLVFAGGIISLILIPPTLEALPTLITNLGPTADMLTFFSLGFVLILLGVKSMDVKVEARKADKKKVEIGKTEKERLQQYIKELEEEIRIYKRERKNQ